jgi:hypothetical protein
MAQCAALALNRKLNGRPSQWRDCCSIAIRTVLSELEVVIVD